MQFKINWTRCNYARAAVTYSLGLSEVRFQVRHGLCFCDFI